MSDPRQMCCAVSLRNVCKAIKGRAVLDDVSLDLASGGIYGFCGSNGAGKTMLFRAIAGLIHLDSGRILIQGKPVTAANGVPANVGVAFGASGFWDEYSGFENLRMLASIKRLVDTQEIRSTLSRVGLNPSDKRSVHAYSMGMRQRLNLAQAIMEKPSLLILDEPTNAIDAQGLQTVANIIRSEKARGATVLIACHNEPAVEELFDQTFLMADGRVVGRE